VGFQILKLTSVKMLYASTIRAVITMEAINISETSLNDQTTHSNIPEDNHIQHDVKLTRLQQTYRPKGAGVQLVL
jgi:hypothetical protein